MQHWTRRISCQTACTCMTVSWTITQSASRKRKRRITPPFFCASVFLIFHTCFRFFHYLPGCLLEKESSHCYLKRSLVVIDSSFACCESCVSADHIVERTTVDQFKDVAVFAARKKLIQPDQPVCSGSLLAWYFSQIFP